MFLGAADYAGLPSARLGPHVRESPYGGDRRITKTVVPDFEARRPTGLQGPAAVVPLGPELREAVGINAVAKKRQVAPQEHRPVTATERALMGEARYYTEPADFAKRHAKAGPAFDAFRGTAIKASLDPTAPAPPQGSVEGLQYRRRGSVSASGQAIREDHVGPLLGGAGDSESSHPRLEGAMHSTAGDRQRTFDVKVQSDNIKAVLDPQYTNAGSGGGELMFGLGGSVAGTGGMVRRNYGHDAQRGDQAALLMLHTPSVLPSDFRDEDGTRKGRRAPVSTFQNRSDNVGMLLAEPAARAAAVAASRNASAASSPNSCSASSSSASSSSSAAVGARPRPTSSYAPSSSSSDVVGMMGHQRGEASWHEPQSLSQPAAATLFYSTGGTGAGAAPSPRPNESPALMIPGQARVLKYNRDLEGSRGIITGTRVDTPVDDRPKTAGPLHTTTARDSVGAVIRGQPTITGPQLGVQPQDARGNPLGLRSGRQGGLYGAHLHQSSIQFG